MTYTGKELTEKIKADGIYWQDEDGSLHHVSWDAYPSEAGEGDWLIDKAVPLETVHYGREDEHMVVVQKLGDQYFRLLGEYDSWNGTTWDWAEYDEVTPQQVTKTVYVPVGP